MILGRKCKRNIMQSWNLRFKKARGMTDNKYWIYLEELRRSGATNMYGATPYLEAKFGLPYNEAKNVLLDWMKNYNPDDYED